MVQKVQQVDTSLQTIERVLDMFIKVRRELRATRGEERSVRAEGRAIKSEQRAEERHEVNYFGRKLTK